MLRKENIYSVRVPVMAVNLKLMLRCVWMFSVLSWSQLCLLVDPEILYAVGNMWTYDSGRSQFSSVFLIAI